MIIDMAVTMSKEHLIVRYESSYFLSKYYKKYGRTKAISMTLLIEIGSVVLFPLIMKLNFDFLGASAMVAYLFAMLHMVAIPSNLTFEQKLTKQL